MSTPRLDRPPPAPVRRLTVREVDPTTDRRWDAFVAVDPHGMAFHRSAWIRVLAREYDQPGTHLLCEDDQGRVTGVLPLVRTRGVPFRLAGHLGAARLSSLPRTPLAGPLADGPDAAAALLRAAVDRARADGVRLQLKPVADDLDGLVPELGGVDWRRTYVIDLPEDPTALRFGNPRHHGRIRRMVHKAEREGVRVRAGTLADLDAWYLLYLDAMRLHRLPARPKRLFATMIHANDAEALGSFTVAELGTGAGRRIVAGVFHLTGTRTCSYAFTGLDRTTVMLRPVDALLWDAIHHACAEGLRRYDLGEVPAGDTSLAAFKLKWGSHPEPLRRLYWPPVHVDVDAEGDDPTRRSRLSRAAWQHLPLRATAAAGRLAYHFL
ncbi:MAG: GNAT family N-acetyltransferase [Acidimicrobiales bacterium]|jgi:CelD/BcsL family acetyltransferase involved in cellulose biosynthesis|nr:GNAT family N-acetyltransferase [Acidimicrobiales bacterium]